MLWMDLNKFLKYKIVEKLDIKSIVNWIKTNRQNYKLGKKNYLWKTKLKQIALPCIKTKKQGESFIESTCPNNLCWIDWYGILKTHNIFEKKKQLILYFAIDFGYTKLVKFLIKYGVHMSCDYNYIITKTVEQGNMEIISFLLNKNDEFVIWEKQALKTAKKCGQMEIVDYLLFPEKKG